MQLEAIEPSHGTLALGRPALHRLVHVHPLNVTRHQRCGVYDGNARALAQGAGLKEQQQVKGHLCLPLHKTVVGDCMGKFLLHVPPSREGVAALCKAIGLSCRLYYLAICGTQKEPSLLCLLFVS